MRRSERGFTLVELMVGMVIIAILAMIALISTVQSKYDREMDQYASAIIAALKEARSRAINTGRIHVVHFYVNKVRWCEIACPPVTPPTCAPASPGSTCLPVGDVHNYGKLYQARTDGPQAVEAATVADFNLPTKPEPDVDLSTGFHEIYFKPDGSMDGKPTDPLAPYGFTIYLKHQDKTSLKYRIAVLPLSGEIRKFNTWAD